MTIISNVVTTYLLLSFFSLVVKNSKRSDGGQYRLQLRNSSGFDTATVNVRVLDRPSPPQNLRADEFAGDALTLFWNPPKDNGGADVTNYVIEKREPRQLAWTKVCFERLIYNFYVSIKLDKFMNSSSLNVGKRICNNAIHTSAKLRDWWSLRVQSDG